MDRNAPALVIRPRSVRLTSVRLRPAPRVADESMALLIALVSGAFIGYLAAAS